MSGFLVVTYTQEGRQPQRRRRRRDQRRDLSLVALMLTALTRLLGLTGATHYLATLVATAATNKKVFDIVTNTYVDPETLLTPFQRRLELYHQAQLDANRDPRWRQLLNNINDAVDDDGVRLFHRKRLDQWRLTYRQSQPLLPQNKLKSVGSVSDIGSVGSAGSIRPLLALPRFWGTVYQDIKIELTHAACDYFDVLPPVGDTIAFFTTVVDGVLAHVNVVSADTSGVTAPDELTKLRAAVYWYLADDHAAPLYAQYQQFMSKFSPTALALARTQATLILVATMVENVRSVMTTEAIDIDGDTCGQWRQLWLFIIHQMFALVSEELVETRPAPARPTLTATVLSAPLATLSLTVSAASLTILQTLTPLALPLVAATERQPRKKLGLFAKFKRG